MNEMPILSQFEACPTEGALGLLALLIKSGRFAESRLDEALDSIGLTFVKWRMLDAIVRRDKDSARLWARRHLNDWRKGFDAFVKAKAVTADQIQAVALKYFQPGNRTVITGVTDGTGLVRRRAIPGAPPDR